MNKQEQAARLRVAIMEAREKVGALYDVLYEIDRAEAAHYDQRSSQLPAAKAVAGSTK